MPKKKSTQQMAQTKQCQYVQRSNEKARNKSNAVGRIRTCAGRAQ